MGTQPREVEREEIATLARRQSMQFVEDHDLERAEQLGSAFVRQRERNLLRRGQQDVRGEMRWQARRGWGGSPGCRPSLMGKPISSIGVARLRAISTASALSGET